RGGQVAFEPILRRRLYQEIAARIEHMIREGDLPEGESLPPERELMGHFAVGRPAIREALLSLQQKGLIVLGNGERARVSRPDADRLIGALSGAAGVYLSKDEGVHQFQAARKLFEAAIAREAARIATDADIARIEAALAANRAVRGDAKAFEATDVAFHLEIVCTAGNPLLTGVHQALTGWLTEQRTVSLTARGAEASAFGAHVRILAAIAARDPDAAEAEMQRHLDDVAAFYWRRAKLSGHVDLHERRKTWRHPRSKTS
ncbi:MAG: FCD domain-containing protein, partial [Acetobacteraceae bacterium]